MTEYKASVTPESEGVRYEGDPKQMQEQLERLWWADMDWKKETWHTMVNDSGVVYNGNPTEMQEGMTQLPDAGRLFRTSKNIGHIFEDKRFNLIETFISLLKNGDSVYVLVAGLLVQQWHADWGFFDGQAHTAKTLGLTRTFGFKLMGALQDRLIFIGKKGTDHVIIPYSEINRVIVSNGWLGCDFSIYKKDGNLIKFGSVLKVASRHFDSWFSSYSSRDMNEVEWVSID